MINRTGVVGSRIIIIYSFSLFAFQVLVSTLCVPEPNFTENTCANKIDLDWLAPRAAVGWSWFALSACTCGINRLFTYCKGGNFNIHIWAWFGYFIC